MTGIPFIHDFEFRYGIVEPVTDGIRRIVARNPGPFTGPGTGTYIIGRGEVAVIDPGPMLPDHVDALLAGLAEETVSHILVTHTHADHSPAARLLRQRTGAPVFAFGPHAKDSAGELEGGVDREFVPDFLLDDGDEVPGDGWSLEVIHTPGHCSNHICFAWPDAGALFCGDHIMAWSTPVIIPPDGSVGDYIESLGRLSQRPERVFYPTHGTPITDPGDFIAKVREHRLHRVEQVAAAIANGVDNLPSLRRRIYTDIPRNLEAGAELSLLASILYLQERGHVFMVGSGRRQRYVPT
ncbi:MAG: MBL fold metallo-hydrolase [Gammaproteobacteria bacterium]|nr:MBL fold metallo-hydrolase [Gammaproteobacteria bacterium]